MYFQIDIKFNIKSHKIFKLMSAKEKIDNQKAYTEKEINPCHFTLTCKKDIKEINELRIYDRGLYYSL